jgi:1,4-dihydroxy-2-naphthoyl-CoA hydrolase
LAAHLNIQFIESGDDYLTASMPVNHTTIQPLGILHGGASCVLAETVGSTAANFCIDFDKHRAVGLDINANHLKTVREGLVIATATPIHLGRRTQVWRIVIKDEAGRQTCESRLTMAVIDKP